MKALEKRKPVSRADMLKQRGQTPKWPPLTAPHLFTRFMQVGPIQSTGMGRVPISWQEIDGWANNVGFRVGPWERRLYRQLSVEFLNESVAAEDWHRPPPFRAKPTKADIDAQERALRAAFG